MSILMNFEGFVPLFFSILKGLHNDPIDLPFGDRNAQIVYSPHVYGPEVYVQPWFKDSMFPNNLKYIWEDRFGFINSEGLGHLFIGEFGIKNNIKIEVK